MTHATIGLRRELAREREQDLERRAARRRLPSGDLVADAMPAISFVAGVVLALAIGAPTGP